MSLSTILIYRVLKYVHSDTPNNQYTDQYEAQTIAQLIKIPFHLVSLLH